MTLGEFLSENLDIGKCCILMFDKNGEVSTNEYNNIESIDAELLKMEYMEHKNEDDLVEIWVR